MKKGNSPKPLSATIAETVAKSIKAEKLVKAVEPAVVVQPVKVAVERKPKKRKAVVEREPKEVTLRLLRHVMRPGGEPVRYDKQRKQDEQMAFDTCKQVAPEIVKRTLKGFDDMVAGLQRRKIKNLISSVQTMARAGR